MVEMYRESEGDLSLLADKTVAILGYGNQGQAWAQNLRDSGVRVVVGSVRDSSYERAVTDGFDVCDVPTAVRQAQIHSLLVPDEIMPKLLEEDVVPSLADGHAIAIASGYNAYYDLLKYPPSVDVIMIAPRMIGTGVRNSYVDGTGFPSLVAVHHDATGRAKETMLALANALGTLKRGAFASSCYEETLCDLFNEHVGYVYALRRAYEVLVKAGASPEAAMLEFWASGEEMELARVHMTHGLFHQLKLHSQTSQYGQEVTGRLSPEEEEAEQARLQRVIERIKDGSFAREWAEEQAAGFPVWKKVRAENLAHPMMKEEGRLLRTLGVLERTEEPESAAGAVEATR